MFRLQNKKVKSSLNYNAKEFKPEHVFWKNPESKQIICFYETTRNLPKEYLNFIEKNKNTK